MRLLLCWPYPARFRLSKETTYRAVRITEATSTLTRHKKSDPKVAFLFAAGKFKLLDDRFQFTLGIAACHRVQRDRFDLARLTSGTEGFIARLADFLHGLGGHRQEFARIDRKS